MKPSRYLSSTPLVNIPVFLAPAFAETSIVTRPPAHNFSSTAHTHARTKRDLNRRRGESVIRSTGPRHRLPVQNKYKELPTPQAEEDRQLDAFPTNPNHGLYGFFNKEKETVVPPEREELHGRCWEYQELVFKKFDDLHALYWQGLLEINRIRTRTVEHKRLKLGHGQGELRDRLDTVRETLRNIRRVLKDRQDAYEEAKLIREREGSIEKLDLWLDQQNQLAPTSQMRAAPRTEILSEPEQPVNPRVMPEGGVGQAGQQDAPSVSPRPTS